MSSYYVSVGKNEYQVDINKNQCRINGEDIQADLTPLQERGFFLLSNGLWKREFHVEAQGKNQYSLDTQGLHSVVKVEKNSILRRKNSSTAGSGDLVSPMPGLVLSVHVKPGDRVEKGQLLVMMESMKMQMAMNAAAAGEVTQVGAVAGKLVSKGDVLVKIKVDAD